MTSLSVVCLLLTFCIVVYFTVYSARKTAHAEQFRIEQATALKSELREILNGYVITTYHDRHIDKMSGTECLAVRNILLDVSLAYRIKANERKS